MWRKSANVQPDEHDQASLMTNAVTIESPAADTSPAHPSAKSPDAKLRMPQLDALRGIAALSVFCFHAISMLPAKPKALAVFMATPLGAIFHGRSAVWLFFVL